MSDSIRIPSRDFSAISFTAEELANPAPIDWDKFWADYFRVDLIEEEMERIRRKQIIFTESGR